MLNNVNINVGSHFIRHQVKIGKRSTGIIVVGGLITRIVMVLSCDLDRLEMIKNSSRIALDACLAIKMITRDEGRFCLVLKDHFPIPFPNPDHTIIQNRANWLMIVVTPILEPLELPGPLPTRPESARHSFAFGYSSTSRSTYDFLDICSSIDAI